MGSTRRGVTPLGRPSPELITHFSCESAGGDTSASRSVVAVAGRQRVGAHRQSSETVTDWWSAGKSGLARQNRFLAKGSVCWLCAAWIHRKTYFVWGLAFDGQGWRRLARTSRFSLQQRDLVHHGRSARGGEYPLCRDIYGRL